MPIAIDLGEAKRRFEKTLALRGYSTKGGYGWRPYGGKVQDTLYYMLPIPSVKGLRGLLWPDDDEQWFGAISLKVGDDGEMMIAGGPIKRAIRQLWAPPPFKKFLPTIEDERTRILRWDLTPITEPLAALAIDRLSDYYKRNEQPRKASAATNLFLRGEISEATVSEALSIVQYRLAKTRTERLQSALIWRRIFS